ncbi:MAG: hypothetical protein MJZ72_02805 [Bacteroidales bacterium]|nr:hypothetical protein [Bacteroidales bacterium]
MKKIIVAIMALFIVSTSFSQTAKTKDELKAERQALKSELTSKDNKKIEDKYTKIVVSGVVQGQPSNTGLNSVDGLVATDASLLNTLIAAEKVLQEYKISINESADGEVNIDKFTPSLDDYVKMLPNLITAVQQAVEAADKLQGVQNDVKGLNPMTAAATIKAANWATNALPVTTTKLKQDVKLLQNLIESCKAAKNL